MGNNQNNQVATRQTDATVQVAKLKDDITKSVINKIQAAQGSGLVIPENYNPANNITLALIELSETKNGKAPLLSTCTPASVAVALYKMCILGLSLAKKQCDFIAYGNTVVCQPEYTGRIAMAKRLGRAGTPNAQVIYEGDTFEYTIDVTTGNKKILKHEQSLGNIDKNKIVGAWCAVPYADEPDRAPFVDIMTIDEIHQSWAQGATKGNSPAHRNFPAEMCKKTVISRACKLFIAASDDADVANAVDDIDDQTIDEQPATVVNVFENANVIEPEFTDGAPASGDAAKPAAKEKPAPAAPANDPAPIDIDFNASEEFPDSI